MANSSPISVNDMEIAEIVKALRGESECYCTGSETYEILREAADALETLQAKLTETTAERDALLKSFKVKPVGLEERGNRFEEIHF